MVPKDSPLTVRGGIEQDVSMFHGLLKDRDRFGFRRWIVPVALCLLGSACAVALSVWVATVWLGHG